MAESAPKDVTVIGKDAKFTGEMTFDTTVRVLGTFDGKLNGSGELQVAGGAMCKADVEVKSVVVDGTIEGNVFAKEKLQLNATSVVKGDVVAGKMVMAEGATLFGQCAVGAEVVKAKGGGEPQAASSSGSPSSSSRPAESASQKK